MTISADASTAARNKAVVVRLPNELYNERRLEVIDEIFAPDARLYTHIRPGPEGLSPGREGIREAVAWIWAGWPDSRVTVEQVVAEGDLVATRFTFSGTHAGILHGNKPTGRKAAWNEIFFARVQDDQIQELWHELDIHGILEQIGVLRPMYVMGPIPRPIRAVVKQQVRLKRRLRGPRYRLDSWRAELESQRRKANEARG